MAGLLDQSELSLQRDAFFHRVLHQHARMLYRVAYSILRHPEDAEDAVSDAVLKLLRGERWKDLRNERSFLARTVWRCSLDRLAARPAPSDEALLSGLEDGEPSPEVHATKAERLQHLQGLMEALPAELREPLLLSTVQDLNSREIAEVLDLPEGTVRTRAMRARQELRARYLALTTRAAAADLR